MCCVTEPGKAAPCGHLQRIEELRTQPYLWMEMFIQESNVCHRQDGDERKADEQVQLVQKKVGEERDIRMESDMHQLYI